MANPLTLLMPVVPNTSPATIANALAAQQSAIETGLTNVGTVHFSRFLLLDSSQPNLQPTGSSSDNLVLGVITEYDGDFDVYIQDFVDQIGGVFDALLVFVVGGGEVDAGRQQCRRTYDVHPAERCVAEPVGTVALQRLSPDRPADPRRLLAALNA